MFHLSALFYIIFHRRYIMKKEKALKSIGNNIQLARLKKGLTQEILAENVMFQQNI